MARRHWAFLSYQVMQMEQSGDTGDNEMQLLLRFKQGSRKHSHIRAHLVRETWNIESISKQRRLHKRLPAPCAPPPCVWLWQLVHLPHCRDTAYLVSPISFSQAARAEYLLTGQQPWAFHCMEAVSDKIPMGQISLSRLTIPFWQQDNSRVASSAWRLRIHPSCSWMQRWQASTGNAQAPRSFQGD